MDKKKYLVTSALPYANGYIHLGHIAGAYLPADMYVRYRRLHGDDILFIGGSDEHGTAIEISAMKENVTPKEIIDRYHFANKDAFEKLGISFDIFSRTSTEIHHKTAQEFFLNLYNKDLLYQKREKQLYSKKDKRFLADRFVEGTCPICGYEEARGDQCENCGSNLSPFELINPKSKISGDTPVVKESVHFYFPLEKFQTELESWLATKPHWKANVKNYCEGWFKTGLKDRAITRDLDWGVSVPLEGCEGKVIYVWFEAVLGYISNTKEYFVSRNESEERWKEYWSGEDSKLIHFIGKDNIIFHAILFPAMIMAHGDMNLPDNVPANEFLNVEGGKFSKSKGKGSLVKDILEEYNPDLVRYVIASNLPENKDSEFSMEDFRIKNNNELAAILGNFINRTVVFAKSKFDNVIPEAAENNELILNEIKNQAGIISECYENFRFRDALTETMNLARMANKYFNDSEPWKAIKSDKPKCAAIINNCLQICMHLAIAFKPLLPFTSEEILKILNADSTLVKWDNIGERVLEAGKTLGENKILFPQIEQKEEPKEEEPEEDNLVDIDYFRKINLRVAKILECEKIEKSKKLLKLKIKIDDREKQIVAGVAEFYSPEDLIGKNIAVVDNLKKSKLMGVESQGMLLAAKKDGKLKVLFIDPEIPDGGEIS
ncbi:MAG TPA: methionine--tRNA ligase [Ignavibacteria bacterium]|nr:methionine--tRNA ligase [Ignavibacteria bacterium]